MELGSVFVNVCLQIHATYRKTAAVHIDISIVVSSTGNVKPMCRHQNVVLVSNTIMLNSGNVFTTEACHAYHGNVTAL